MMFWRQRDLALETDPARRYLPWLIAMIVYLAGLSLAGMMGLSSAVDRWDKGLTGTITVQVPPAPVKGPDRALGKVLSLLRATPGITEARPLDAKETAALLEPWLGTGTITQELPLPRLIDVKIRPEARPDMKGMAAVLADAVPGTEIDDHKRSLDRLITFARSVELVALIIVILVALAAIATVIFITRTGLAIHIKGIELLHLIGAHDGYVARQFQGQALELGLKGGAVGLVLMSITIALLGRFAGAIGEGLLPRLDLSLVQWGALIMVPIGVTIIGMITAHFTVINALRRMP